MTETTEAEGRKEALAAELQALKEGPPPKPWSTLASRYGAAELERDKNRELVRIDTLPAWLPGNDRPAGNHGLGSEINAAIGGGIAPGTIIGVGAAAAKSGKTAFIHQLADGLALRAAEVLAGKAQGPLTPLIILSEMDPQALSWRTLARWTGYTASHFRAGKSAESMADYREAMWDTATKALAGGLLDEARKLTRIAESQNSGQLLIEELKRQVKWLRSEYREHKVLPIIMVDPIQRFMATGKTSANESMDEFANALNREARAGGWCVLLTSDATKATAMGTTKAGDGKAGDGKGQTPAEEGAAVFRGSYTLQHILDSAIYLRPTEKGENGFKVLEVVSVFNRWGPLADPVEVHFHGPSMRVYNSLRRPLVPK